MFGRIQKMWNIVSDFSYISPDEFIKAIKTNDVNKIQFYINRNKNDKNLMNVYDGHLPVLFLVLQQRNLNVLNMLCQAPGIDINVLNIHQETPLMWAARYNDLAALNVILENPFVNINYETYGETPFLLAAKLGHSMIVEALLNRNMNINYPDLNGNTALMWAARKNHLLTLQILTRFDNLPINETNDNGDTALMIAARFGHLPIVQYLLTLEGILIHLSNKQGLTAAMEAAQKGHYGIQKLLQDLELKTLIREINQREEKEPVENQLTKEPVLKNRLLNKGYDLTKIPKEFLCPLSNEIFEDPITLSSGYTVDRGSLKIYFGKKTLLFRCPVTSQVLASTEINNGTNEYLKTIIENFVRNIEIHGISPEEEEKKSEQILSEKEKCLLARSIRFQFNLSSLQTNPLNTSEEKNFVNKIH